ncbi:hypothetical protein ACWC9H_27095 [Streptomyces sp. NPDC001251]
MATPDQVPAWPLYELRAADNGTVTLTGPAAASGPYSGRPEALAAVAALAARHLRPPRAVRAEAVDADGTVWPLIIDTDGTAREDGPARRLKASRRKSRAKAPEPVQAAPVFAPPQAPIPVPAAAVEAIPRPVSVAAADDEPTRTVRIAAPRRSLTAPDPRQPATPHAEQHDRAQQAAPVEAPAAADGPRPAPPTYLGIRTLAEAGRLPEARQMAIDLDRGASQVHGPSHRTALEAREVLAHITAQSGDLSDAVRLYRDVAERWWHQNARDAADQAAGRAHALWLRIADPRQALAAGQDVVRMRQQIPGPDGRPYRQALRHMTELETNQQTAHRT